MKVLFSFICVCYLPRAEYLLIWSKGIVSHGRLPFPPLSRRLSRSLIRHDDRASATMLHEDMLENPASSLVPRECFVTFLRGLCQVFSNLIWPPLQHCLSTARPHSSAKTMTSHSQKHFRESLLLSSTESLRPNANRTLPLIPRP